MTMNRMGNAKNPFQGDAKKVLCVCSAGLLRSPTTAVVLSQPPFSHNTRAVGLSKEYALIPIDDVLLAWADEIVCMTTDQFNELSKMTKKPIICLDIPDNFRYMDEGLIDLITWNYDKALLCINKSEQK